jgi:hypothetical protein
MFTFAVSIVQNALAEIERKRFNAMPREQQEFVLKKRQVEALERIAAQPKGPIREVHYHYY